MREADTIFFHLEDPAPGATLPAGRHLLRGWLVPKPAFHYTDVRARVGSRWFRGVHGFPRPDLAAHFQGNRAALLAGFTVEVVLEPGPAVILFEALELTGQWQPFHTVTCQVTVAAPAAPGAVPPLRAHEFGRVFRHWLKLGRGGDADRFAAAAPWPRALREEHPPFHGFLDEPAAVSPAQYGQLHVLGWLVHETQPVRRAFATADLVNLQPLELGGEYSAMRARFPSLPRMDQCRIFGFANVPAQLPAPVSVRVFAELADGSLHLALAVLCRPLGTEELKAGYPAFSFGRFWSGWCGLHEAWQKRGVPLEAGRNFWREAWQVFQEYRRLAPPARKSGVTPVPVLPPAAPAKPRRLLLITHNLNREGAPLWLLELARHFVRADGARLLLLSPSDGVLRAGFEELGAEVRVVDASPFLQAAAAAAVPRAAAALAGTIDWSGIDLVIANTVVAFWGVALAHAAQKRALLYIHESTTPAAFFRAGYGAGVLPAVGAALRTADAVSFLAPTARAYYDPLSSGANYCITPGWIDLEAVAHHRAAHDRAKLRERLGFRPGELVVVNVGTVCGRKGQHVFVNALELLWRRHPALAAAGRFLLVGGRDDPYNGFLRAVVADLGRPNVALTAETASVYDYFSAADLFVCTSYEESFPRVVLEAMAFGLPIVASDVHAIPTMVQAEHEAILVPPGDTEALMNGLVRFLGAPEEARRWGARARARVEHDFSGPVVLPRHSRLVSGLAAAGL
jgi:glycosyltransferase involved in cell wall biosynthesis